jgi:integrase
MPKFAIYRASGGTKRMVRQYERLSEPPLVALSRFTVPLLPGGLLKGIATWVLADLEGKGRRIRTVAVPIWVKQGIEAWTAAAGVNKGRLLRSVSKSGKVNRDSLSDWAVWSVVEQSSKQIGIEHFGAHDLRRTCAKLCRKNGGDLEQIKFLLGHSSIQTTERYLGSDQEIAVAVNDNLGL